MVNTLNNKTKRTGKRHLHKYSPRGGCKEVMEARDAEVLISGPAGTGKSRACLEKIYMICMLTPNTRALILRKTLASLGSSALVTWRNYVVKEAIATGQVVYYGGSKEEPAQYRFKNGSSVTIGGLDKPSRIMSTEYDIIYVQEATEITLEDLEMINTRLRNWNISFQQLLMDCNPAGTKHPLKLRCNEGITRLIESRHEDNPRLFEECSPETEGAIAYSGVPSGFVKVTERGAKYIAILDKLTGVRYQRLRLGRWVSAEGIVYEEFDPVVHVLAWAYDDEGERIPLPDEWERIWGIDWGYRNPFVCKWYAIGDDGEVYMYREIYMTGRTVGEHAQQIMDIVCPEKTITWYDHMNKVERSRTEREWIEPQPTAIIADHDLQARETFRKATGLGTQPAIKDVSEGIDIHKDRLKVDPATGLARFYLMADCLVERDENLVQDLLPWRTEDEYSGYAWKVSTDGRKLDEPVKKDDHGLDVDRYVSMYLDFKGKARVTLLDA
jgi:PBSX family phage terminase large subunit